MSESLYVQLLYLAVGAFLLAAVLVLWRRQLPGIVAVFAAQGIALTAIIAVLAVHERSIELGVVAVGIGGLRAVLLPKLMRRTVASTEDKRDPQPLINVPTSLVAVAVMTTIAFIVMQPIIELAPRPSVQAVPVALTVVFIGFFTLVTRRRAVSQVVGFMLIDNGITAVAFLATGGVPFLVELGVSLDVLLAVIVLQVLTVRLRVTFGHTDLDDMRELRDS